jgi:hypothetical protein
MAVEVQELTIKSTVSAESGGCKSPDNSESEKLKETILADCRQMLLDLLRAERER